MVKRFFRFTLRNWGKNKTYSFLNIFGLAIGIACAGLIFLWVEDEKNYDDANLKKDWLYDLRVNMNFDGTIFTNSSTPRPMGPAMKAEIPGIMNIARLTPEDENALIRVNDPVGQPGDKPGEQPAAKSADKAVYAVGRHADSSLFSMLTLPFVAGSARTAFVQLYSLVLTEKAAAKIFGPRHPADALLGRTVRVDNKQDYAITGILKDLPANSSLQFEWLAPFEIDILRQGPPPLPWNSYGPFTYVELDPKADPAVIDRQLADFIHRKDPPRNHHSFLFPMKDWRLYDQFENGKKTGGGRIAYVHMLSWIAWIILLIACINFMNLATARSQQRSREIGVCKVLGAAKGSLVFRFLLEAVCLSALAALVAVALMALTLPVFNELTEKQLVMGWLQPVHLLGLLAIILVCGLVAGSYPSLYLSSFNPITILKGLTIRAGSDAWVRKGLVVLQFSFSIVFIIATITIFRQIQYVKDRNLGFDKERLIEIDMQHSMAPRMASIRQDLLQTGVVENAAMIDHAALYDGSTDDRFDWSGKTTGMSVSFAKRNVSPHFFETAGLHIVAGRDFGEDESSWHAGEGVTAPESANIVITESAARLIGQGAAAGSQTAGDAGKAGNGNKAGSGSGYYAGILGKILQFPANEEKTAFVHFTVVGVVNDFVYGNMHWEPGPVIFFCRPPGSWDGNLVYVRTKTGSHPSQALTRIASVIQADNPAYPFKYIFVDDQFNGLFKTETLMGETARVFAILAVLISCLGLFGLAAYTAERRTREIGIRKVLGASVAGITGLLSKDFLQWVGVSCAIAFPVAWWLAHDWLKAYQYRITLGPGIFVAAGVLALLIAWVTIGFQAIRAAMANPVRALRRE